MIENWETDDGLPENSATSIVQTPDGYLWFGTFNGLVRFDGIRFQVLTEHNTPGLPGTAVVNLHLDRRGNLWVSADEGLARLDPDGWRTIYWKAGLVRSFAESSGGDLYASGFDGGIFRFDGSGFVEIKPPVVSNLGYLLAIDESDRLLAAQTDSLWRRDGDQWTRIEVPFDDFRLGQGRYGSAWLISNNDLARLEKGNIVSREKTPYPIHQVWGINEDSSGNVWIASYIEGLYVRYADGSWDHFYEEHGLGHGGVRCVAEDREGNRWVGTSGGGLHRFTPSRFSSLGKWAGLPERVVKAVVPDDEGGLYVGTYGQGVVHWKDHQFVRMGSDLTNTPGRFVYTLLKTSDGKLLAGTHRFGVMELTERSWSSTAKLSGKEQVFALFEDRSGVIWIGADTGLFRYRKEVVEEVKMPDGSSLSNVRQIAQTPSGQLIVAAGEGVVTYADGKLAAPPQWSGGAAMCVLIEGDVTWAGTKGSGLIRLDPNDQRAFTQKDGVPDTIGAIVKDDDGNMWLASNVGVVRVERAGLEERSLGNQAPMRTQWFDIADGLPSVECPVGYGSIAARATNGWLWFATLKGIALIDPKLLKLNAKPPPVYIEEVRVDGQPIPVHVPGFGTEPLRKITIPPGPRRIEISYSALSLMAPQKITFQTRFTHVDKEWQNVGGRRTAYLQDLRPGNYQFLVRAANNDRVWNEEGAALAFTVEPYFYQTWLFRVGFILGLSGFVWFGFRKIVRDRVDGQVERMRQQAALSEVQARLALVLENTSDVVSFATRQGNLLFLNRAGRKLLGIREGIPVAHLRLGDLHPASARTRVEQEAVAGAIASGSWQGETALMNCNGPEIPVSLLILAHHHADGSIDFISTIARDISEAKRAEEARSGLEKQLRAAQKMEALGTLAGGIAHDFNNILTGILGNAELLRAILPPESGSQQQITNIVRASARARDLIKQMLAFGRPQESGRAPVLIWLAIEEAVVLLRASIPASIEIISECKDPAAVVQADLVQIHQVIMNLGANSAHAMAEKGGQLTIRQEIVELNSETLTTKNNLRPGSWVKVSISDTGHGMSQEIQERIFEPFFTTKGPGQGTGLGLAVVHGIVRSHGGVVIVRSAPSAGSTFELYFPLAINAQPPAPEPRQEIAKGRGEKILLVDDEEMVLKVAANAVTQLGYECVPFTDPVDALIYFQANAQRIDLLLTDLSMPRLSGAGLATAIREIRPDLPVIISTGFSGRLKPGEAEKAGARAILSKPYQMHELAQALRRALEKVSN